MAVRKALVLVSGEIQQLQSGDTLAGPVSEVDLISATNGESSLAMAIGEAVYISAASTVKKAKADAPSTADVLGLAASAAAAGAAVNVQTAGIMGGLSGLTAGATYYLSAATAGLTTATPPSATGQTVTRIGKALSTTEMEIDTERPILL